MGKDNAKDLVKKKVGRPTKKRELVVKKLESVFKLGVSDEVACRYAKISKPTFYDWCKKDEEFLNQMTSAKDFSRLAAGNVVMDAIVKDKDVTSAKWWLEKKYGDEFKSEKTQIGVGVNVPVAIEQKEVDYDRLAEKVVGLVERIKALGDRGDRTSGQGSLASGDAKSQE